MPPAVQCASPLITAAQPGSCSALQRDRSGALCSRWPRSSVRSNVAWQGTARSQRGAPAPRLILVDWRCARLSSLLDIAPCRLLLLCNSYASASGFQNSTSTSVARTSSWSRTMNGTGLRSRRRRGVLRAPASPKCIRVLVAARIAAERRTSDGSRPMARLHNCGSWWKQRRSGKRPHCPPQSVQTPRRQRPGTSNSHRPARGIVSGPIRPAAHRLLIKEGLLK